MLKLIMSTKNRIKALAARPDRGATAAEYALIVAVVIAAVAAVIGLFGAAIAQNFTDVTNAL